MLLRNTSNYQDANTETKTKRERTVASTAVIFEHRLGVLRSDSLPLFNQILFKMRNTNDDDDLRVQQSNLYVHSLAKAFKEFVLEESQNYAFTEERLLSKIKAAKLLFPEVRQVLQLINRKERRAL